MPIEGFAVYDVPARTYHYSPDGRLFAYALPTVVRIFLAEGAQLLQELSVPNVIELRFCPRGTYISTWERSAGRWRVAQGLRVFSALDWRGRQCACLWQTELVWPQPLDDATYDNARRLYSY
ncbi:hypothetical protein DFJ58DRAFT_244281 [Suillus subalutaceus]|uniref:uncharacterized protein n=1 Tax=Suillus subalutaceus TaxID=48586 RepID=UPI001B869FE2|nr:uncharacterized protein DFJ58DRAFT_244281 [Suillus subalutaceus]KAG1831691.1 hypothetical protein DFJ58DRAFT_244281 [Suillus subalutaceus]